MVETLSEGAPDGLPDTAADRRAGRQTEADLAQARQNNALELKGRGAGTLVKQ